MFHDIKDIFIDAFNLPATNEDKPIIEKLVHTTDTISDEDLNSNTKLLEWSTIKFHTKVLEKISSALALRQVELATKMESVKNILENIFSLYTKLCDVNIFIHDIQRHVEKLEGDLKTIGNTLKLSPSQSQLHF